MMFRAGWVLLAVACAACGGKKDPAGTGSGNPPVVAGGSAAAATPADKVELGRLFSEAEIRHWLDDLTKRLAANAKRSCPGPQVVKETTPGPATDALVQLFEGKGELAGCITKLAELGKSGTLKADVDQALPSVIAFDGACGVALADKVLEAAAHVDGCSPYQTGVRAEPKELIRAIQIAHVVVFHARQLAAAGKSAEAVDLSLAALRVMQDLTRGHVTMIVGMISAASSEILGAGLDGILASAKLPDDQRATTAAALDALIAGMPRWADLLAGERDNMDIYFGAAQLMPKGWTPPGGWNEELRPKPGEKETFPTKHFGNPRDESAVLLAMTAENAAELARVCPEGASYAVCQRGLEKLATEARPVDEDPKALYDELAKAVAAGSADVDAIRLRIRGTITRILKSIAQPSADKYPVKMALAVARLVELRLHLAVMMEGTCPSSTELAEPPYPALAAPAALGDAVELRLVDDKIEVSQPRWSDRSKVWTFPCGS
jgi:hypothetical protein